MQAQTPFIINLDIHPHGYTFHSTQTAHSKPKKTKSIPLKNSHPKIVNRLMKQIAISSQIPPIIPEENAFSKDIHHHHQEPSKHEPEYREEEEQIDYEVKREGQLPPCPAHWFDHKNIHEKEIQYFQEFFTGKGSKTPELYTAYRNFISEAYKSNPKRYLTFVSCRRVLRGDVSCLLKIYQFMVREGVINYGLSQDGNYNFKGLSPATVSEVGKKPQSVLKKIPEKSQQEETQALDTDNLTVSGINKNFSRNYRVYCNQCRLICGIVWYTHQVDEDRVINLCFDCYNLLDKATASIYTKTDITKRMESGRDNRKSYWGLDDNIKLLDFMGNSYGRGWAEIDHYFEGKKSIEDILLQFMQFPITNFNPFEEKHQLNQDPLDYKQQEYIKMLEDLYEKSEYANCQAKEEEKEEPREEHLTCFRVMNKMMLSKVNNKIKQLKQLETLWELSNIQSKDQTLVNRCSPSTYLGAIASRSEQENSDI